MTTQELIAYERSDFMPALSVPQAIQRFNTLVEFVQNVMHEGVDYGKVPGTDKNTLMKAGAEKLTTLFGLTVRFQVVEQAQDWSGDDHGGEAFFYYWYRCLLSRGDLLIAEADGSCNSRESKYRWREAKRKCPQCGAAAINRSKYAPRGAPKNTPPGWYCYAKAGGCGVEFSADDPQITGQSTGRAPNPDICDLVNTIQKMAQKRAMVAAVLIGCNASEFFTQDLDDILVGDGATYSPPVTVVDTRSGEIVDAPTAPQNGHSAPETRRAPIAGEKQRNYIVGLQDKLSWSSERLIVYAREQGIDDKGIGDLSDMTVPQASALIEGMKALVDAQGKPVERPLVKRLRELVGECRSVGVPIPDLPKPRDMTDEKLDEAIQALEIEYSKAQQAAESVHDDLSGDVEELFNEPVRKRNYQTVEELPL